MGKFGIGSDLTNFTAEEQNLTIFEPLLCNFNVFFPGSGKPVDISTVPRNYSGESQEPLPGGGMTGALTQVGMQQALSLGGELSNRYVGVGKLLPNCWTEAKRLVTARSTFTQRTLKTARGVLSGLYPADAKSGRMDAEIDLSGAPEHQVYHRSSCAKLKWIFSECMRRQAMDSRLASMREILRRDTVQWSHDEPIWEVISARDQYACREAEGKDIHSSVMAIDHELNVEAALAMHKTFTGDGVVGADEALRLSIGRMVAVIIDTMEKPDGKLHLYSGHDWTVTPLLLTSCRHDDPSTHLWPPFCSNISFETWSDRGDDKMKLPYWGTRGVGNHDDGRYVRTVYNGKAVDMPCSEKGNEYCTMATFRTMMERYRVVDYEKECRMESIVESLCESSNKVVSSSSDRPSSA